MHPEPARGVGGKILLGAETGFVTAEEAAVGVNVGRVLARAAAYDAERRRAVVLVGSRDGD